MGNRSFLVLLVTLMASSWCHADEPENTDDPRAERAFTLNVLPLLKVKCFGCHGEGSDEIKGELDLTHRHGLLRGGETGSALVPGKPDESLLMEAIRWDGLEMPPKENDRLSPEQIESIRTWIAQGAPWPSEQQQEQFRAEARQQRETKEGVLVDTSGGTSDAWTDRRYDPADLWAWQPLPRKSELVTPESLAGNPVDHFIRAKLTTAGFEPAPQASPEALIRRASFDLVGLPPSPTEIDAFRAAWQRDSRAAWNALIDRLLDSPHYGERWAQHWLDVSRYADTGGMSNDYERSNLWRYRDYVVRALNDDKPYDRFVIEQLAGDELADASVRQRSGGDDSQIVRTQISGDYTAEESEWIVATGFLRLGPWDNAMVDKQEARQIFLDDIVNVVGQTFLSTTLRCVKCHDHKFDPIPTRDYYRIYAAFSTTQMAERPVPWLPDEQQAGFEQGKQHVQRMLDFAVNEKSKLVEKRETAAKKWFQDHGLEYQDSKQRQNLPDDQKPPRHVGLDHVDEGQLKVREQDEWIWKRRLERYQPMAQSVYDAGDVALAWNGARKLRIDPKADRRTIPTSHILTGGALTARGDVVEPGVLSATGLAASSSTDQPYLVTKEVSGRRLDLARWVADPRNPLTARSIVNRVWQHHFGRGIARNPNNFGAKGARPTHPQLLDYLAADFVEHGWKLKRLHRLLMQSEAYQQASHHPDRERLAEQDPANHWLAYFPQRRLTAEEMRDAMLSASGELNRQVGGLPAMPEINMEVALQPRMIQFSLAPAYQPSATPAARNRRTLYAYRVRGQADPFLELFNQPNPNDSCELRDVAAVTPQAFTLLNSDMITDRSIAMAVDLQRATPSLTEQINQACLRTLGRPAANDEHDRLASYVADMVSYHRETAAPQGTYPTTITRSLVEEFSGKPFEYQEILPVFESYQPDLKAADVTVETRALADLCLLLFNTNEFIFLR